MDIIMWMQIDINKKLINKKHIHSSWRQTTSTFIKNKEKKRNQKLQTLLLAIQTYNAVLLEMSR